VPDTDVSLQPKHVALEEDIGDESIRFSQTEMPARVGQNTGCILTPMLKHCKPVVQQLIDVGIWLTNDTKDAAHAFASFVGKRGRFLSFR
jgi:hypothetical protein